MFMWSKRYFVNSKINGQYTVLGYPVFQNGNHFQNHLKRVFTYFYTTSFVWVKSCNRFWLQNQFLPNVVTTEIPRQSDGDIWYIHEFQNLYSRKRSWSTCSFRIVEARILVIINVIYCIYLFKNCLKMVLGVRVPPQKKQKYLSTVQCEKKKLETYFWIYVFLFLSFFYFLKIILMCLKQSFKEKK